MSYFVTGEIVELENELVLIISGQDEFSSPMVVVAGIKNGVPYEEAFWDHEIKRVGLVGDRVGPLFDLANKKGYKLLDEYQ